MTLESATYITPALKIRPDERSFFSLVHAPFWMHQGQGIQILQPLCTYKDTYCIRPGMPEMNTHLLFQSSAQVTQIKPEHMFIYLHCRN